MELDIGNRWRILAALSLLFLLGLPTVLLADCFDPALGYTRAEAIVRQTRIFQEFRDDVHANTDLTDAQIDQVIQHEFPEEYSHLADAILQEMEEQAEAGIVTEEERAWRRAQESSLESDEKTATPTASR